MTAYSITYRLGKIRRWQCGAAIQALILLMSIAVLTAACAQVALTGPTPHISPVVGRFVNRTSLWERSGRNVLSGFRNLYNFRVLHEPGAAFPYKAWFFGWAVEDCNRNIPENTGCDAIFHARAKSLYGSWEVYAGKNGWDATQTPSRWVPVVTAQRLYYDEWHNGDPSVVKVGRRYYMAYSSTGNNKDGIPYGQLGDKDGSILCIMGAVSEDGIHWRKSKAPLLLNPSDVGAPTVPEGDSHPYGSYQRPSLLYVKGRFCLWFDYWVPPPGGVSMGYAENRGDFQDPAQWKIIRAGKQPCLKDYPNPNVAPVGGLFYAYADPSGYDLHPWKGRKIAEAVSLTGKDWVILGYVEPDADAPAIHVPESFLQREGGVTWMYLFYACQIGGEPYDYRYDRIRCMRRRIKEAEIRSMRSLCRRKRK